MEYDAIFRCMLFVLENNVDLLHEGNMKHLFEVAEHILKNRHLLDNYGKCDKSGKSFRRSMFFPSERIRLLKSKC